LTVSGFPFVLNTATGPSTITATAGTVLDAGSAGGSFFGAGAVTIGAAGGSNVITQSGAGAILLGGGDGSDTIVAGGTSGTVTGGAGNNVINENGSGILVQSQGTDVVSVSGANDPSSAVRAR